MSKFPGLNRQRFEQFLMTFSYQGSLIFRNNKWIGRNRDGKPFVVHVKHGTTRKYPPPLVEAVAKDLGVTWEKFQYWLQGRS